MVKSHIEPLIEHSELSRIRVGGGQKIGTQNSIESDNEQPVLYHVECIEELSETQTQEPI